jgi:hypothetical protein
MNQTHRVGANRRRTMAGARSRSQQRRPAMGRSRVGRRRPPGRSRLWFALPLVLVLGVAAAVVALLGRDREAPETAPVPADAPAAIEERAALPAVPQAADSRPPAPALEEEALLTPQAAESLLRDARGRAVRIDQPLDTALYTASLGFSGMDRATLDELSGLFAQIWSGRPPTERDRILEYVRYVRTGDLSPSHEVEAGRQLFQEATHSLSAASRERLRQLMEVAIAVGLRSRQQAEERGGVAALNPPTLEEGPRDGANDETPGPADRPDAKAPTSAPATRSHATDATLTRARAERKRKESYWRGRATAARRAVEAAEARVRELEEQARRLGPYTPLPDGPACQEGVSPVMARGVVALRDDSVGAVTCNSEVLARREAKEVHTQLEVARANLQRQKEALDNLADEARRAGALPGWLR